MSKTKATESETETAALGALLAESAYKRQPTFVQVSGPLGAGKTALARGFILRWLELSNEPAPETVLSPSYNIVKVYGTKAPLAHLDLYRLKTMTELENIGFEHYFFEHACCLIEWLEQIPEALAMRPALATTVEIEFGATPKQRLFKIKGL